MSGRGEVRGYLQSDLSTCEANFGFCFSSDTCIATGDLSATRTATCWTLAVVLLSLGVFLCVFSEWYGDPGDSWYSFFCCFGCSKPKEETTANDDKTKNEEDSSPPEAPFLKTNRSQENFCKNHDDPTLETPTAYSAEYKNHSIQKSILPLRGFRPTSGGRFLFGNKSTVIVTLGSLGMALVCSSMSTLLWMALHYEDACLPKEDGDDGDEGALAVWFEEMTNGMIALLQGFVFFPVFLLVGYISFIAYRWRDWMVNCHAIQGAIHDIGVVVGGSFIRPPRMEQRKLLYKIYRKLNTVHALCYKSVSESLCHLEFEDFQSKLGLLTKDEMQNVIPYPSKAREAVLTTAASEIAILCKADNVAAPHGDLLPFIANLRARMGRHHDLFIRDNPNSYLHLMFYVVNVLIFFTIVTYPFTLMLHTPASFPLLPCFQPGTLMGVFLVLLSYRAAFSMIIRLRNPFSSAEDRIQVDMLLASTEMCLFTVLRNGFVSDAKASKKETRRQQEEELESYRDNDQKLRASFDNNQAKKTTN